MRKLYAWISIAIMICLTLLNEQALASSGLLISQVQPGAETSKTSEFIELYNNSDKSVDITGWCIYYASASSDVFGSKKACYMTEATSLHLFIPGHSYSTIASSDLMKLVPDFGNDILPAFSATMNLSGGHIRVVDNTGREIDKLGWGDATQAEGNRPVPSPINGNVLSRKIVTPNVLQDTDINYVDFEMMPVRASYNYNSIDEIQDLCSNLDGIQTVVPDGRTLETDGSCNLPPTDICSNLPGLQTEIPTGYVADGENGCVIDVCPNLENIQTIVPEGLIISDNNCVQKARPLQISELLPNAIGNDTDNEFIELYNPNESAVNLKDYELMIGPNFEHAYDLPAVVINPSSYFVLHNDSLDFTLVNTTSRVRLRSLDGYAVYETPSYVNPFEGEAWVFINGVWQYTNQPTPGAANLATTKGNILGMSSLSSCKLGYERNQLTGRCRKITTVASLTPCKAGYERNPATNRCRKVASAVSTSASCKAGYERNSATNRCRKIVQSTIPTASYAPKLSTHDSTNYVLLWSIIVISIAAVGYGLWEWKSELYQIGRRLFSFVRRSK